MKCELCHERDAETAIQAVRDGVEDELYVCRECAKGERLRRQKKSQRTRKGATPALDSPGGEPSGLGAVQASIVDAVMSALDDVVSDLESARSADERKPKERKLQPLSCDGVATHYRFRGALHLEGLFLLGEIDAVRRAMHAIGMELSGWTVDGVRDAGHAYSILHAEGDADKAERVVKDLVEQERNARDRLVDEMPRVFGDALCRALAILKNCRLLSPGELFDLLSPLRLAAINGFLDGIGLKQVEKLALAADLSSKEDKMDVQERDRVDAERADEMNRRFEDVVLNERAEEMFL